MGNSKPPDNDRGTIRRGIPRTKTGTAVKPWDPFPGAGLHTAKNMTEAESVAVSEALAYLAAKRASGDS